MSFMTQLFSFSSPSFSVVATYYVTCHCSSPNSHQIIKIQSQKLTLISPALATKGRDAHFAQSYHPTALIYVGAGDHGSNSTSAVVKFVFTQTSHSFPTLHTTADSHHRLFCSSPFSTLLSSHHFNRSIRRWTAKEFAVTIQRHHYQQVGGEANVQLACLGLDLVKSGRSRGTPVKEWRWSSQWKGQTPN
uniref:Uncharacterized protein n=1 Tax=Manihot esculenta TaxID=3983 RepID=A0A2C9V1A6_MANES